MYDDYPYKTNPVKAIRAKCRDCLVTAKEIERCSSPTCELYPFRFGTNPFREKRTLSPEQRERQKNNLAKARLSKQVAE